MSFRALLFAVAPWGVLAACGGPSEPIDGSPDPYTAEGTDTVWEGHVVLDHSMLVDPGDTLTVAAGTTVEARPGSSIDIRGTMLVEGTADQPVVIEAPEGWQGIALEGTLVGTHLHVGGLDGKLVMVGGELDLVDSSLDLRDPTKSPDCTSISGGTVQLDHVRITGCHCPIHVNSAEWVEITNSVLDGAAVAVMIAQADASLLGNHIEGELDLQDIGGGISADVTGNYWGGDAPTLHTDDDSQFRGLEVFAIEPLPDVGPSSQP